MRHGKRGGKEKVEGERSTSGGGKEWKDTPLMFRTEGGERRGWNLSGPTNIPDRKMREHGRRVECMGRSKFHCSGHNSLYFPMFYCVFPSLVFLWVAVVLWLWQLYTCCRPARHSSLPAHLRPIYLLPLPLRRPPPGSVYACAACVTSSLYVAVSSCFTVCE